MSARSYRRSRQRQIVRQSKRDSRARSKAAMAVGAGLGATVLFAPSAQAATFTVNTLDDHDDSTCNAADCTLREAIDDADAAGGPDVITFAAGLSGTITLDGPSFGDLNVNDAVTINGPGAGVLAVSNNDLYRVFDINTNYDADPVVLSGLTIRDGYTPNDGGAVRAENSLLEIRDAAILSSEAGSSGGGIYALGSDLTVERTTVSENRANADGGGIFFFENNVPSTGIRVSSSTLSDNYVDGRGGGGITVFGGTAATLIENSTISGNESTDRGGGAYLYTDLDQPMTIRNSTIVDNTADRTGGGIYNYRFENIGYGGIDNLIVSSTIVANNTAPDGDLGDQDSTIPGPPVDVDGSFVLGHSLVEQLGEAVITESPAGSNIIGQDPQLGPLQNNGGPTPTHLQALTSPVVDAGISNGLANDQRGLSRTAEITAVPNRPGSDATDIGAVEIQSASCQGAFVLPKSGSDAAETITGTDGPDAIAAGGGDDTVNALAGKDCALGGEGRDRLKGDSGRDQLKGQDGKDRLSGSGGRDRVIGGDGTDRVKGGNGKDRLKGNAGKDRLKAADGTKDRVNCGAGEDRATVDEKDRVSRSCEEVTVRG